MNQAENKNTPDLVGQLKKHLEETPREQLEKEWKELKPYGEIGPTVSEYLRYLIPTESREELVESYKKKYPANRTTVPPRDVLIYQQGLSKGLEEGMSLLEQELPKRIYEQFLSPMLISIFKCENKELEKDYYNVCKHIIEDIYNSHN